MADQARALLVSAAETGDVAAAATKAQDLFDRVALYAASPAGQDFAEAAIIHRLLSQLAAADVDRPAIAKFLAEAPRLSRVLPLLVTENDDPTAVYAQLEKLIAARGSALESFANLTAALCVVHQHRPTFQVNENRVVAPDAVAVFDYFSRNDQELVFSVREVPAELLVFVVDTTAGVDEMQWALDRYAGQPDVGRRFFEIEYDYDHLQRGTQKAVTREGLTLPNIRQYGGVCADQAYFAASVGKSLGIPAVYACGRSGDVGHAWVGFLSTHGGRPTWDFDAGRYDAYQGVRGIVMDARARRWIDDNRVSLLAELAVEPVQDREAAAGLTDAAARLGAWRSTATKAPALSPLPAAGGVPRDVTVEQQLTLLETALRACPAYAPAWDQVAALAGAGELDLQQKRRFADAALRLCGDRYPDFAVSIVAGMIATVDDPQQQHELWDNLFDRVAARRFDLAAGIRFAQGQLWERMGDLNRAGRCYQDAYTRYPNGGPMTVDALQAAERLVRQSGRTRRLPELYAAAWKLLDVPSTRNPVFAQQSNWYRVGLRYAQVLDEVGQTRQSQQVRQTLDRMTGLTR